MKGYHKRTPELLAQIQQLKREGKSLSEIRAATSLSKDTIQCWLDPKFRDRRNRQKEVRRHAERPATKRYRGREPADITYQLAAPPPKDTRSLTGRLLGDPLAGRSALDRRREA